MVIQTVVIFDAVTSEFKGEFYFNVVSVERDLTSRTKSIIKIFNNDLIKINDLDILFFPNLFNKKISGIIKSVNNIDGYYAQEIEFYFGADIYDNDVLMIENSLETNGLSENNGEALEIKIKSTQIATGNDNLLGFDSIARQIMRKRMHSEIFGTMKVEIVEKLFENAEKIRLDDPQIKVTSLQIAADKFNTLVLYNTDNLNESQTYYLNIDGSISTMPENRLLPQKVKAMKVESDNWNSLAFAKSTIKEQEYNNKLEFSIPIKNNIEALQITNEALLGQRLNVKLFNGEWLETIVSGYKMENNVELQIICGLTRTRLSEILKIRTGRN